MKIKRFNKKAQETLMTDVFVTLLIVVIISASFFVAKTWTSNVAKKKPNK